MNLEEVYNSCEKIEQSVPDCEVLIKYTNEINPPNCYVEIGTKCGGSAILIKTFNPEIDVYTIDCTEEPVEKEKLNELGIRFFHEYSERLAEVWGKPIQVLFIDGNHNEVLMDFNAWEKYVVKGGIILFHDYAFHSPNVIKDCNEIAKRKDYEVLYTPFDGSGETGIFQIKKLC
jgi:predicted O-methyltransferase YrrM